MEFSVTGRAATSHAGALSSTPPPSRRRKMTLRSLASASGSPTSFLSFTRTAEPLFSQSLPRKRRRKQMQNAHLRLGQLEYLRSTAHIRTSIRLQVDRYMGDEAEGHLLSLYGGDAEVGAIAAAVHEKHPFTLTFPDGKFVTVSM